MAGRTPHGAIHTDSESIFKGEHLPDDAPEIVPERALWLRVIGQAWVDAFEASDWFLTITDKPRARDPDVIRAEARRWLTIDFGLDADDRQEICDLAGIDADALRSAAKQKLDAVKAKEQTTAEVIALDRAFARLLESESTLDAATIDAALADLAELESAAA